MGRAPCCDKAKVKKGPWSPEEDATLKAYIDKNGTGGNWIALPQKIGLKRCGKSCRLRWLNYLRPNIKHGGFTEEEDNLICSLYISIGSRWSIIAAQLPGRTDNDIKNYWNTRLKKKLLGKQRKDQRVICHNKQEFSKKPHNNFNFSDQSFGLYPLPPPPVVEPPFSMAYPTPTTTHIKHQPPISGDLISHFGERSYPYDGLINTISTTLYTSDVNFSTLPPLTSDYYAVDGVALDHFQETNVDIFGQIDEVFVNNNVNPRELREMENLSRASQESCSWGDINNSVVYSSSIFSYEVCQQ